MSDHLPRLVLLDDYQKAGLTVADWSALAGQADIEQVTYPLSDQDAVATRLAGVEIVVAMRERTVFDAEMLARLPDLRLLVTTGMVNASIDMAATRRQGVTVCGTPGSRGSAAEFAWALVMALARNVPTEVAGLREGDPRWQRSLGFDLRGRTLGIAGFGNLGQRMARFGKAFDMNVVAWSRSLDEATAYAEEIRQADSLDDLLAASDILTLHLPLNEATRGLIGARELGLMKPGSCLVNTARGPIVDEGALVDALTSGHLRGAGLDVFAHEPLPLDHPFRTLANVVATPHIGYVTEETYRIYYSGAAEAVAAWLDGTPVRVLNA